MLIGYARVSTVDQNLALQRDALTEAGCQKIFTEQMSGAVTDRPALHDALEFARSGDMLIVWKLDRLARSMKQLIETIENLRVRGIGFRSLTEALDTTTAQGRLVFHMFGALAEFERSLIRERTQRALPPRGARAAPEVVRQTHRRRHRGCQSDAGQPRHRRHSNRTPSWCLSGDAVSLHPRRAHREYPGRLRTVALPPKTGRLKRTLVRAANRLKPSTPCLVDEVGVGIVSNRSDNIPHVILSNPEALRN
jgi:hypothetical protein